MAAYLGCTNLVEWRHRDPEGHDGEAGGRNGTVSLSSAHAVGVQVQQLTLACVWCHGTCRDTPPAITAYTMVMHEPLGG